MDGLPRALVGAFVSLDPKQYVLKTRTSTVTNAGGRGGVRKEALVLAET